jgi:hypothetical protein
MEPDGDDDDDGDDNDDIGNSRPVNRVYSKKRPASSKSTTPTARKRVVTRKSAAEVLEEAPDASDRRPQSDPSAAYRRLVEYCNGELQLVENERVAGDGACMFRVAAVQLRMARPELAQQTHESIRYSCARWVFERYNAMDPVVLRSIGYEGWADWHEQMLQPHHYGDELCLEAIAGHFRVRILLIFANEGVNHRYIGDE